MPARCVSPPVTPASASIDPRQAYDRSGRHLLEPRSGHLGPTPHQAGSLEIEPSSLVNAIVDVVSELLTKVFGKKMPNAPMILFSQGPFCNGTLNSIGRSGKVVVKSLTFDLFGGLIKDVHLLGAIEKGIGLLPGTQPLVKWAKAIGTAVAGELLDFEVSSEAAKSSEKEKKLPPVTSDAVIEVIDKEATDSFLGLKSALFHGVVTAKAPGLSAVQATLDLGKCLGKASDNMFVWVTPSLENQEVRNESGRQEEPLNVPLNGNRTAHAVGMLTAFPQGTQPITIPFDPIGMSTSDIKKFIEKWVPGGKKIVEAANLPIEITYPATSVSRRAASTRAVTPILISSSVTIRSRPRRPSTISGARPRFPTGRR